MPQPQSRRKPLVRGKWLFRRQRAGCSPDRTWHGHLRARAISKWMRASTSQSGMNWQRAAPVLDGRPYGARLPRAGCKIGPYALCCDGRSHCCRRPGQRPRVDLSRPRLSPAQWSRLMNALPERISNVVGGAKKLPGDIDRHARTAFGGGYVADRALGDGIVPGAEDGPAAVPRRRGRGRQDRDRQGAGDDARPAADPPAML